MRSYIVAVLPLLAAVAGGQGGPQADALLATYGLRMEIGPGGSGQQIPMWDTVVGGGRVLPVWKKPTQATKPGTTAAPRPSVGPVTLSGRLMSGRAQLVGWLNDTVKEPSEREDSWKRYLSIGELFQDGTDGRGFSYMAAFPSRYVFPKLDRNSEEHLTESVVVHAGQLEPSGGGRSFSSTEALRNPNFRVDLGGTLPAESVEIDDLVIPPRKKLAATKDRIIYVPGIAQAGTMTIRYLLTKGEADMPGEWFKDCAEGNKVLKDITIEVLKADNTVGRGYYFFNCQPVRWIPGEYSGPSPTKLVIASITVKIDRVEFG